MASSGAATMWGVSGLACHKKLWGVPGHCPRPNQRNVLHSAPSFRRASCTSCRANNVNNLTSEPGGTSWHPSIICPTQLLRRIDQQGASRSRGPYSLTGYRPNLPRFRSKSRRYTRGSSSRLTNFSTLSAASAILATESAIFSRAFILAFRANGTG
jgi:hypothetical protein